MAQNETTGRGPHSGDLGFLVRQIDVAFERRMNQSLERSKLTRSQAYLLKCLMRRGGEATLKELERDVDSAQSTTWGIARRLEEKGFVRFAEDPSDSRARIVQLTEAGREECQSTRALVRSLEEHLHGCFTPEEHARFVDYLERTRNAIESWEDPGA